MKTGITLFSAMLVLILLAISGIIEWSTLGFIMALTIIILIAGLVGFFIVTNITKKTNNAEN